MGVRHLETIEHEGVTKGGGGQNCQNLSDVIFEFSFLRKKPIFNESNCISLSDRVLHLDCQLDP